MEDTRSVASLMDSTSSKIQQLQKAFAELESQRAVTLNLKWKELEEHFHGLERSLKRRFHELEDQEKEYETKTRKAQELLEIKKAAVEAKEKASLERLQKKRDAAMFTINSALDKYNNAPISKPSVGERWPQNAVGDSSNAFAADSITDDNPDGTVQDVQISPVMGNFEVKAYPQLLKLCGDMDSAGLHKFVSDNRKNLASLKEEIPMAFRAAANPASLVLDSLEGFYPMEAPTADGKKDANLLGMRRTCIMLMECLSILLSGLDPNSLAAVLSQNVKRRAKSIAEGWNPLLQSLDMDACNGNSLEAHAFLQLLASFAIVGDFKEDELLKLIPMVSRRRQAAELCRSLGLAEKMPGVIEVLVNSGKQIDADEFNERELTGLKTVIKCIEEHNLEEQYPAEPLHKRILQLEKAKADKKRATEPTKPQPKRPRGAQPRVPDNNNNNIKTGYGRVIPERLTLSVPLLHTETSTETAISTRLLLLLLTFTSDKKKRQSLTRLSQLAPFPDNSFKLTIWKLSFRLWNACVDLSNAASLQSSSTSAESIANLRHVAADMLFLAKDVTGVPSPTIKSSLFYYRTGLVYHSLKKFDLASGCFERATEIVSKIDITKISDAGEKKLFLDLNLARSRTAWGISDRNLAVTLLNRAKNMLFGSPDHYKSLSNQFLAFGKSSLSRDDDDCSLNDALRLMNEALDLCEKGLGTAKTREDTMEFTGMRIKTLRFISAVHLQKGEFENVIKCVKVLRNGGNGSDGADQHASLPVLAMKAWLGLGRHSEAEKELRGMVGNNDIPEAVWVSAVEAYFEVVGTAGAETAKGVFLGLLGRCHVSAKAALRVAHRVLGESRGGDNGSRIRANVVAQLVSDERVVALFAGEAVTKERKAIHSVLWNSASDHFRAKDYETSAEMFEKSMLYIPHDIENRVFRAKGFRVLCLCYLGLSQLDRALEYIEEAEKFKIYLQKKDHSSHEAISCQALPVAVASLSKFLSFYISGKTMPTTEVVVFRTLITILTQDIGSETEALNFMLQAQSRASKLGTECFFGSGETGKRERNWFAVTCWNLGSRCGNAKKYELCGEFLRLASEFYSYMMDTDESGENKMMICRSIILNVTAMIALEKQNKSALTETQVKLAAELLIMSSSLSNGKDCIMEPELIFMYTLLAYDIHGRLNNSAFQLLVVKTFAGSKSCHYNYLLQLGIFASQSPQSNPDVSTFALNECLSALIASASPDYPTIALIIRKLIFISSIHKGDTNDEEAILKMYKQAYRIMVGLKEGEYPTEEGKWLAMTAWNRAALPVRLGQFETAKKWLSMGLEIAEKVTGMDTYKACMQDYLAGFQTKVSSA
ncbi:hypothetical protein ARALYDRAFT_331248 [Arabidopsis lyrata subsp. lyrata]|uniref:Protein ZIP4 homolog n=1 Tax=Arabidopsis lyrata subsp. lyrata TaxID=81972 RepID=D7MLN3_ARALL|nr:hypothetical protein ARALYDRAFT_331248 [Arabidopsis lyrata subsp. lyrata]